MLKQFLENIIAHIVDNPDQIKISEVAGDSVCIYELRVGQGDYGKVIGKHGRNADAIRILLSAVSSKDGKRGILEIIE
jgi:predicted RNA-binding protein YlqC (UPF0109 family)